MQVVLASNDPVELSFAQALLKDAAIPVVMMDVHTSILEGSIGAIPRRLMVADTDLVRALALLEDAGLRHG